MSFVKLLLISSVVSLLFGQLIRLPVFSSLGAISLTDIFVATTDVAFLAYAFLVKKSLKVSAKIFIPSALFIVFAFLSTFLALTIFSPIQIMISLTFLFRFIAYFFLSIVALNIIKKKEVSNWINLFLIVASAFVLIGFAQFIFFPDLTILANYGWDPHQKRIFTTFLDPNFSGFIFSMLIAFSISFYLYEKKKLYLLISLFAFIALILTFSRSSYLATLAAVFVIGVFKSPKVIFVTLLIFILSFLLSDKVRSRIIGAFSLDETSMARIESWTNGLVIFKDNPFFGVGFNTYRFAQENYGFFSFDNPEGGHSGSGSDSSFILILVTTGILGFGLFLFMLSTIFLSFLKKAKFNCLNLALLSSFSGLIIHSQFVNSFFFPQIMLLFWFFLGLKEVNDS